MRKRAYPVRRWNPKRAHRRHSRRHSRSVVTRVKVRTVLTCPWVAYRKRRPGQVKEAVQDLMLAFYSYGEVTPGWARELRREVKKIVEGIR